MTLAEHADLCGQIEQLKAQCDRLATDLQTAKAENEKIRGDLNSARFVYSDQQDYIAGLRDENAKLTAVAEAAGKLAVAAFDFSRAPRHKADERDQHYRLNEACVECCGVLAALDQ